MPAPQPDRLTIADAARLTGLSKKALRHRIYRGQLPSELHQGLRVIPREELDRAGLLTEHAPRAEGAAQMASDNGHRAGRDAPAEVAPIPLELVGELLDRVQRQAVELDRLRRQREGAEQQRQEERTMLWAQIGILRGRLHRLEQRLGGDEDPPPPD